MPGFGGQQKQVDSPLLLSLKGLGYSAENGQEELVKSNEELAYSGSVVTREESVKVLDKKMVCLI